MATATSAVEKLEIEVGSEGWRQRVLQQTTANKLPSDFLALLSTAIHSWNNLEDFFYDGGSREDWLENPRLCLLRGGEKRRYEKFHKLIASVKWDLEIELDKAERAKCSELDDLEYEMDLETVEKVEIWGKSIGELGDDEELVRFLKEELRVTICQHLANGLEHTLWYLNRLRRQLEPAKEEIEAMLEDEMEDFVWPDECRKEDAEQLEKARVRRQGKAEEATPGTERR